MLEKEIKVLEIDVEKTREKLEELWAKMTFEWFIHDVYYDFPWEKMWLNDRIFRVRKKWEVHLYTIKRKRNKTRVGWEKWFKIADEHEMEISDVESFSKVLERYWLTKVREKKKHRFSYSLDWLEFDIDVYDDIPPLIEIEAHTTKEITTWIKKLWFEKNTKKDFGSRWLFEYYEKDYLYL